MFVCPAYQTKRMLNATLDLAQGERSDESNPLTSSRTELDSCTNKSIRMQISLAYGLYWGDRSHYQGGYRRCLLHFLWPWQVTIAARRRTGAIGEKMLQGYQYSNFDFNVPDYRILVKKIMIPRVFRSIKYSFTNSPI